MAHVLGVRAVNQGCCVSPFSSLGVLSSASIGYIQKGCTFSPQLLV